MSCAARRRSFSDRAAIRCRTNVGAVAILLVLSPIVSGRASRAQADDDADAVEAVEDGAYQRKIALAADNDAEWMIQAQANPALARSATFVKVECALVRRVCNLTDEQKKRLAKFDRKWVQQTIERPAQDNRGGGLLAALFGGPRLVAPVRNTGGKAQVRKSLASELNDLLTDEQLSRLAEEHKHRDEFKNRTIAEALVESLIPRLGITDTQRDAIVERLMGWVDGQDIYLTFYFSGNNYYPDIPRHLLSPHLSQKQMRAYENLQRYLYTDETFFDGQQPIEIED